MPSRRTCGGTPWGWCRPRCCHLHLHRQRQRQRLHLPAPRASGRSGREVGGEGGQQRTPAGRPSPPPGPGGPGPGRGPAPLPIPASAVAWTWTRTGGGGRGNCRRGGAASPSRPSSPPAANFLDADANADADAASNAHAASNEHAASNARARARLRPAGSRSRRRRPLRHLRRPRPTGAGRALKISLVLAYSTPLVKLFQQRKHWVWAECPPCLAWLVGLLDTTTSTPPEPS